MPRSSAIRLAPLLLAATACGERVTSVVLTVEFETDSVAIEQVHIRHRSDSPDVPDNVKIEPQIEATAATEPLKSGVRVVVLLPDNAAGREQTFTLWGRGRQFEGGGSTMDGGTMNGGTDVGDAEWVACGWTKATPRLHATVAKTVDLDPERSCLGEGTTLAQCGCVSEYVVPPCGLGTIPRIGESECQTLLDCESLRGDCGNEVTQGSPEGLQAAIDDATDCLLVRNGTYPEDVVIEGKKDGFRLETRCDEPVEITGTGTADYALSIRGGGDVTIRGPKVSGIQVAGDGQLARLEHVWLSGGTAFGLDVREGANVTVKWSLIEENGDRINPPEGGVQVDGLSDAPFLRMENVVVRGNEGVGVNLTDAPTPVELYECIIERNAGHAVQLTRANARIEESLVRVLEPGELLPESCDVGQALWANDSSSATLLSSNVGPSCGAAILVSNTSDVTASQTLIRDTLGLSGSESPNGDAVAVFTDSPGEACPTRPIPRSWAKLTLSVIREFARSAIYLCGAEATISESRVQSSGGTAYLYDEEESEFTEERTLVLLDK